MNPPSNRRSADKLLNEMAVDQAVILNKLETLEKVVDNMYAKLEKNYVTQDQFEPVKKLVYGMVAIILTAVVGAIITLVIRK